MKAFIPYSAPKRKILEPFFLLALEKKSNKLYRVTSSLAGRTSSVGRTYLTKPRLHANLVTTPQQ
jgi:hypothetical protein